MFNKYMPYKLRKTSKKSVDAQLAELFKRIEANGGMPQNGDFEAEYDENVQPKVYYVEKRSPVKTIIPIAAVAVVIAIAVPIVVSYLRKDLTALVPPIPDSSQTASQSNASDVPFDEMVSIDFKAQYIRTDGSYIDGERYPKTFWIPSRSELNKYYEANKQYYGLGAPEDSFDSFYHAVSDYDEEFFKTHDLIFVVLEEGSGSITHNVTDVKYPACTAEMDSIPPVFPVIERNVPELVTFDMARWHIIIEVENLIDGYHNVPIYPIIDGKTIYTVPQLRDIVNMTSEEAEIALRGITDKELFSWWGEPVWMFSGMYGGCWQSDGRQVIMYFFKDDKGNYTARNVSTSDIPSEEEIKERNFRSGIEGTVYNAETVEQMREMLAEIDEEKRIAKVEVLENGKEITSGYLIGLDTYIVRVYFDEDKVLEFKRPADVLYFDYIVRDTVEVPQDEGVWLNYMMPEFPDEDIRVYGGTIARGDTVLFSSDSIKVAFAADLNGDNRREICAVVLDENGTETFYAYDLIANKLYRHTPNSSTPDYEVGEAGIETYLLDNAANEKILLEISDKSSALIECN